MKEVSYKHLPIKDRLALIAQDLIDHISEDCKQYSSELKDDNIPDVTLNFFHKLQRTLVTFIFAISLLVSSEVELNEEQSATYREIIDEIIKNANSSELNIEIVWGSEDVVH